MGFFTDLKEDISQAVDELTPEEELGEAEVPAEEAEETASVENIDLDNLLDSLDDKEEREIDLADLAKYTEPEPEPEPAPAPAPAPIPSVSAPSNKATDENAVITAGMSIKGDVVSSGSLEVLGTICGNIQINGKLNIVGTIEGDSKAAEIYAENAKITGEVNSQGSVKIGQSTVIIGNIFATSAVIAGAVKGDIDVKGPVVLDTSAIVMGNIKSKSVQINNGAVIEGVCSQCYADVSPTTFFDEFKKKSK